MLVRCAGVVAAVLVLAGVPPEPPADDGPAEALGWFAPWVKLDEGERDVLRDGGVVAKTLPAHGPHLAVFLAGRIETDPGTFLRKVSNSEWLWKSERVPQVVAFSDPPRLADLSALQLDEEDLSALKSCRPGGCDVKLTAAEIDDIRQTITRAGPSWRHAVESAFRRILLSRVQAYQQGGLSRLGRFQDHEDPVDPAAVAARLLDDSPWISSRAPAVARFLRSYPQATLPDADSLFYWLKTTHTPKPTVQAVHVLVHRASAGRGGEPEALVVSRQIFSTHYLNGSLAVSVLLQEPGNASRRVLGYVNRSHVDDLGGWFSGVRRFFGERRIRSRAREIFALQRERLED